MCDFPLHDRAFHCTMCGFPLHDRGFHCTMWLSIARGPEKALYGRVQKSAANPAAVGRDGLLRRRVAALCQALFFCCLSICSPPFPPKVERVQALSASHGGNPSTSSTPRCRHVISTSSA